MSERVLRDGTVVDEFGNFTGIDQPAARRQTPTEFARELAMAYATKEPLGRTESLEIGCPTTGALAGQFFPKVALNRDPDETLDGWLLRTDMTFSALLKKCLVWNNPDYRDELLREALQEIRS